MTRMIGPRRSRRRRYTFLAILGAALAAGLLATSGQATLLGDSGTVDVQVPANTASKGGQTNLHAFITYLGSSDANLMPHFIRAAGAYATLGEMCGVLRGVFGEYREPVGV